MVGYGMCEFAKLFRWRMAEAKKYEKRVINAKFPYQIRTGINPCFRPRINRTQKAQKVTGRRPGNRRTIRRSRLIRHILCPTGSFPPDCLSKFIKILR